MPQKYGIIDYSCTVNQEVDLRVDEVQGVINQVDLSGRSMKDLGPLRQATAE